MPKGWDKRKKGWDTSKMPLPLRAGLSAKESIKLRGSAGAVLDVIAALDKRVRQEEQKFLLLYAASRVNKRCVSDDERH